MSRSDLFYPEDSLGNLSRMFQSWQIKGGVAYVVRKRENIFNR